MRRRLCGLLPVALGFLATSLMFQTGMAQHGAATTSMSPGHAGGTVHAGPSVSPSPRSFAPPPGSVFSNPGGVSRQQVFVPRAPGLTQRYPSGPSGHPGHWPAPSQGRRPDDGKRGVGYRPRYPFVYGAYPTLIPFGYGLPLPYSAPYGDDQDTAGTPQQDYAQQPDNGEGAYGQGAAGPQLAENGPSPFRPEYQGEATVAAVAPVHAQPATTLIFKDGRPPVQVHNYALTSSTLYDLDGASRLEIPLVLLNVSATIEANRAAGIDFALPVSH